MERRDLRHDRHTVSLLTDHIVFSPKYRGKILVGDVALALEGIIRKICKEMKIEIIDMAVNVDHAHLFEPKFPTQKSKPPSYGCTPLKFPLFVGRNLLHLIPIDFRYSLLTTFSLRNNSNIAFCCD